MSSLTHKKLDIYCINSDTVYMKRVGKTAAVVLRKIERGGPGSVWTYEDFKGLSFVSVAKALSRLAAESKIVRVRRGVYYFPKKTALGITEASAKDLIDKISKKKKKTFYPDAATSAYNLRITTQVPAATTLIGDDYYRNVDFKGTKIKFTRRSVVHLKGASDTEIYILETLRNINKIPGASSKDVVERLKFLLKKIDIHSLLKMAKKEPPRVRAVLGALCAEMKIKSKLINELRESLNPLTHYKLDLKDVLLRASEWNIK